MNYMEQVAQMLSVEMEEEFYIKGNDGKFKITKYGMCVFSEFSAVWDFANDILTGILTGHYEIIKPILDEVEKEYLSNVIKPFRDKVQDITKVDLNHAGVYEFIRINHDDYGSPIGTINLPNFRNGDMYKGMEVDKEYTLEELGL